MAAMGAGHLIAFAHAGVEGSQAHFGGHGGCGAGKQKKHTEGCPHFASALVGPARKRDWNNPGFDSEASACLSFRTLGYGTNLPRNICPRMDTVPLRSATPRQLRKM